MRVFAAVAKGRYSRGVIAGVSPLTELSYGIASADPYEQICRRVRPRLILIIDVSELLSVVVAHDKGRTLNVIANVLDSPRRRKAAFGHEAKYRASVPSNT